MASVLQCSCFSLDEAPVSDHDTPCLSFPRTFSLAPCLAKLLGDAGRGLSLVLSHNYSETRFETRTHGEAKLPFQFFHQVPAAGFQAEVESLADRGRPSFLRREVELVS